MRILFDIIGISSEVSPLSMTCSVGCSMETFVSVVHCSSAGIPAARDAASFAGETLSCP